MSADSPRRGRGVGQSVPAVVPPQVVSDRSILDSAIGFINDVTLAHQIHSDPKDTICWARFESMADISDPRFGEDWELEGNVAPPLLLILGYGVGVQVWAIPANGEAVEVLSWRHGSVTALRVLPTPAACNVDTERADELMDAYADKRPLIALCDGGGGCGSKMGAAGGLQPQFCAVNFISLKTSVQVKTIKFKNPVLDILANRTSIVVTFHERIAVFDARTLEDRLSITSCYPSPGINPNPVALGSRWLAYAEHKLLHSKRSGGGCDGEGVASYTATVLNAAKSFGKGLRELGEQVAAGLTGATSSSGSGSNSKSSSFDSNSSGDMRQAGVVTIMDIKYPIKEFSPTSGTPISSSANDPFIAHFIAHSEAVVAMEFDNSGMLLVTADRRGHDFHVFRIQPHPVGSSLAAVHHLYVLHRGDTSAKVQNIAFTLDSRWIAVSTLRGTTHVFPITPYGGPMGVRTHTSLHVVNKLSRFHRSAGLSAEGRSNSPISHSESTTFSQSLMPFHNPTLPPYPRPIVVLPLAQLRQPFALGSPPGSAIPSLKSSSGSSSSSSGSQRQRLTSLSDDNGKPLSVCAIFAKSRSWLLDPPNVTRETLPHRMQRKAVDSLFVMAGHGALIQYDLDTKLASNVAKEKICDETPIELEVEAKAQWNLGRRDGSQDIIPPLSPDNWLIRDRRSCMLIDSTRQLDEADDRAESWLSQVEIITHAGPHRRLWMGPQFVFKTYNTPSGSNLSHIEAEAVEIGISGATSASRAERSSPLNMPLSASGRTSVPVLIESGSYSSIEQSPKLMDRFRHEHLNSDFSVAHGDSRLKEDLADAMRESPSVSKNTATERLLSDAYSGNAPFCDALAADVVNDTFDTRRSAVHALAHALPNIYSYATSSSQQESAESSSTRTTSIEKVVNPLGTVTTIVAGMTTEVSTDILDELVSQLAAEETVIHENCDESLFRPVVAIFCDKTQMDEIKESREQEELMFKPPEFIENKLIVPVIDKERDDELCRKEKQKSGLTRGAGRRGEKVRGNRLAEEDERKFSELAQMSKQRSIQSALKDGCMVRLEGPECKESGSKPKEEVTRASEELQTEKKSGVKNANSSTEKGSEEKDSGKVEGRKSIEKAQICEGIERRQEAKAFDPIAMKANRESEKPAERKQEEKAREIKSRNKNSITKQKHEKTTDSWRETQSQEKTEKDQGKAEERTKKKQANQKVEDERCSTAKTQEKDINLKNNNKDKAKTEEKQHRKGEEDCEEKKGGGVNNDIKGKVFSIEKKQLHTKGNSKEEVDLKSEKTIKSNEEKLGEEIYVSTQKESKNKDRELKDKANSIRDKSEKKTTRNEEKKLPSVDINIEEILVSTEKEDFTKKSQVEEDRKECEEDKRIEDKSQDSSKKTDEVMENAKEPPVEIINVSPLSLGESEKLTADKAKESANKETAGTCNISLNPKRKTTEKAAKSTEKSAKQDQRREPGEEKEIFNQKSQLDVTAKQENNQKHLQEVEKLNKDKETIPDNPATQDESKEGSNLGTKFKSNVVELKKCLDVFVEEFPKSAKKKKQRSNKSTSNSESDEVVEVIATTKLAKGKKKNKNPPTESLANIEKKSSTSSEGSFANLADSLLENKAPIEEPMFISFSKIMEKQEVVDTTDSTEAAKEQLRETKNSEENSTTSECNTEESIKAEVKASSRANLDGINPVEELQSGEDKFVGKFVKDERKDTQKTEEDTVVKNRTQSAKSDSKANKNKSKSVAKTKFDKSKEKEQIDQLKQTEDGKPVTPIEKEEKEADRKPREMESKNKNKAEVDSTIKTNKIASDSKENQNRECTGTVKKQISRKEYKEHNKNLDSAKSRETIGSLESVEEIIKETEMEKIKETNDVIAKKAVGDTTRVLKDESEKPIIFVEESKKSKKSKSENKPIEDEITPCTIITEQPRRKKVETPKEEWVSTNVNKTGSHTSNISGTTVTDPKKCEKSKNREKLNTEAPFSEHSDMKNGEPAQETLVSSDKWSTEHKKSTEQYKSTDPSPKPPLSVWNTLSGADMINQQLMSVTKAVAGIVSQKKNTTTIKGETDIRKSDLTEASPLNIPGETSIIFAKADKKSKKSLPTTNFQDFSILKTLDPLPPLPVLEPLEISTTVDPTKACTTAHSESPVSLINLESPQPENPSSEIKITPPPRGFTQQNLIFALCGSLHYENESRNTLSRSNSLTVGGKSTVNYKSLIENINDEQYLSLEPSNQEQPDSTSSSNSSVSEEVQEIVMESKKLGKKKRHKKTELESTKQKEKQKKERCAEDDDDNADEDHGEDADDDDDEELQPLISLSESINLDVFDVSNETTFVSRVSSHSAKGDTTSNTSGTGGGGGGTTDSEGPMAATTTSDDNNYYGYRTSNTSHTTTTGIKMKTKKLEHKINLIAAIEAATSCSSTSSAEESGVEGGGSGGICGALPSTDNAVASMSTSNIATATMSNIQYPSTATTAAGQQGAAKKKTKRRKR